MRYVAEVIPYEVRTESFCVSIGSWCMCYGEFGMMILFVDPVI